MADISIDFTDLSAKHTSDASRARLRRRYWAEVRLKAYGIAAIALAGAALLVLLSTIVTKTLSVTTEHYLTLNAPVEIEGEDRERLTSGNPNLRANLRDVVRTGLINAVGGEVGIAAERELTGLVSNNAGLELGDRVKANNNLIGQSVTFQALLDDQTQLYLAGEFGLPEELESPGTLTMEPGETPGDDVSATFPEEAFPAFYEAMRERRGEEAERARAEEARQQNAIDVTEAQLAEGVDNEKRREYLEGRLDGYVSARDRARAEAERLEGIAAGEGPAAFEISDEDPSLLINAGGGWIRATAIEPGRIEGEVLQRPGGEDFPAPRWQGYIMERPEVQRPMSDQQVIWVENMKQRGQLEERFNWRLLETSDSASAELAGIWGAVLGSFWTMMVTFLLAFPIGVMASIYLEEFAPKNRLTDLIEVNINNLAAVPSIVFGLLGLAIFVAGVNIPGTDIEIGGFLPRSSPLAGGAVLALMTLPTIIIAGRASIRSVPPSIRDAALGIGASKLQTATHHVLPLAMPGILTGSIIGMAQALGETAPLLLVGMNSFIQAPPEDPLAAANVLPTLIYQWNSNSERLFDDKTAAAISVLLVFLIAMNALAVLLRKRFERRW